jgi:hypothetical protein
VQYPTTWPSVDNAPQRAKNIFPGPTGSSSAARLKVVKSAHLQSTPIFPRYSRDLSQRPAYGLWRPAKNIQSDLDREYIFYKPNRMTSSIDSMTRDWARYAPAPTLISVASLLRLQGYRDLAAVRRDVREIAEWAARKAEELSRPEVIYRRISIINLEKDSVTLSGGTEFHSCQFHSLLKGNSEVVAFVLSLGPSIDQQSMALLDVENVVEALFLEYAGWIAIERATRNFAEYLSNAIASDSLRLTRRLAPGYHDWALDEQREFLALFDDVALPVQLLESCVMLPKKSRTGLYGLQPLPGRPHENQRVTSRSGEFRQSNGVASCSMRRPALQSGPGDSNYPKRHKLKGAS